MGLIGRLHYAFRGPRCCFSYPVSGAKCRSALIGGYYCDPGLPHPRPPLRLRGEGEAGPPMRHAEHTRRAAEVEGRGWHCRRSCIRHHR